MNEIREPLPVDEYFSGNNKIPSTRDLLLAVEAEYASIAEKHVDCDRSNGAASDFLALEAEKLEMCHRAMGAAARRIGYWMKGSLCANLCGNDGRQACQPQQLEPDRTTTAQIR